MWDAALSGWSAWAGWPAWAIGLPFTLVLLGSALQVATGVGLGLIAGPALLFVLDGSSAIQTAIILNLVLTVCLLPAELNEVAGRPLIHLSGWACIGIPLGCLLLLVMDSASLKLFSGTVVVLAVLQLKYLPVPASRTQGTSRWHVRLGGTLSGGMTGALAAPGPVALWSLLSSELAPSVIRATLRAYFLIAYIVALLIHSLLAGGGNEIWMMSLILLPAVGIGVGLGVVGRRIISSDRLRTLLEAVLLLMGTSLLLKGAWDACGSSCRV